MGTDCLWDEERNDDLAFVSCVLPATGFIMAAGLLIIP